jgi:hypothetical protein
LREKHAEGAVSSEDYYATLDALRKRQRIVQRDYQTNQASMTALRAKGRARAEWDTWTVDQQRNAIRAEVAAVVVNKCRQGVKVIRPGEVVIRWRRKPAE